MSVSDQGTGPSEPVPAGLGGCVGSDVKQTNLLSLRTVAVELPVNKCMLGLICGTKLEKLVHKYRTEVPPHSRHLG